MRVLGLDVGEKRIGMAISDELGCTAQGLCPLKRADTDTDIVNLKEIIDNHKINEIVVGLPINMDGTLGRQAKKVIGFVDILKTKTKLDIKTWDERLTSIQANKVLLEADVSRSGRRKVVDKLAAQLILQSYLDAQIKHERI